MFYNMYLGLNIKGEMKRSMSICLSCFDPKIGGEMKRSLSF